jgi:ubiquinone/menaquinone biosynthesis C-methylase UbiE
LIDIGAGSGGATLLAAGRGAEVLAVDASARMVERVRERARSMAASRIEAETMDGMALAVPECSFDAAVSIFGVILFPDPPRGLREIARVLKPGGRAAIVTWTEKRTVRTGQPIGRGHCPGARPAASAARDSGAASFSRPRGISLTARGCRSGRGSDRSR